MRVDNTAAGLSILAACTTDVKQWYTQNGLQLNPDKSEALFMGTATQLVESGVIFDVSISRGCRLAGDGLDESYRRHCRSDRRLTFDNHASCNYHARAIHHIRHLLALDLTQTLTCSLILSRIDY